jgi:hypothetical protein
MELLLELYEKYNGSTKAAVSKQTKATVYHDDYIKSKSGKKAKKRYSKKNK